jgi:aminopeptidase N
MDLPHAPYLFMMAIGEFAIVKDKWRDREVNYYVEPKYEIDARAIFGNTPEMMEFFSKKMGVDYAWPKYSQVVVRDYVSGAMENTSATIHGEFVQQTAREMIDRNNEDIVSHELFHHWFGDLATCESWSNLPLNESFATYGEYLWNEYKYGRDIADIGLESDLKSYLDESKMKQEHLIRFYYENREDMFDRHSYAKGGTILHMLRKYLGDDAFFAGLKLYLTNNSFKSAEVHDLRLAFEEVTGEDLNWFFNQWFLNQGHPKLSINYNWDAATMSQQITVEQLQDLNTTPLYKLPVPVHEFIAIEPVTSLKR